MFVVMYCTLDLEVMVPSSKYYLTPDTTVTEDSTYKMMNTIDDNGFTVNTLGGSIQIELVGLMLGGVGKVSGKPTATKDS